jgi:hypothetical protein
MNFVAKSEAQQHRGPISLQTLDVRDRAACGPSDHVAPWATACLLVQPSPMTESYAGLFETGWKPNPGRADSYSLCLGEALIFVSLEEGVWMVEVSFPEIRKAPVVLGLGCSLVVTGSPQAAAQIAKLCFPAPVSPLQWLPYW